MAGLLRGLALLLIGVLLPASPARAEDGYELWLRYPVVTNAALLAQDRSAVTGLLVAGDSATARATRDELSRGLRGLLDRDVPGVAGVARDGIVIAGTPTTSPIVAAAIPHEDLTQAGAEGYVIRTVAIGGSDDARPRGSDPRPRRAIVIAGNTDIGVLYGAFAFLRLLQTHQPIDALAIVEFPRLRYRILNHWDNLDGTVERGYAGGSLWDWHTLPRLHGAALHRLRARQRVARHQRHGAHQRQRQRHEPHRRVPREGRRARRRVPARTASAST